MTGELRDRPALSCMRAATREGERERWCDERRERERGEQAYWASQAQEGWCLQLDVMERVAIVGR
jgi:hypothetical protein